ncbi:MAG: glycosyltransferase family A protein [Neisseria sp.]|nr:glycosyltransferase family A protein [Neisseria sp.]
MSRLSVAVITASIGKPTLERTIQSVQQQSYPCRHYVFVDGEAYHAAAHAILQHHPQVQAIYLPQNTGKNGWFNSFINAAASFLVAEDIICFLDDDNHIAPNHVASIVQQFQSPTDYVFALRNFISPTGEHICPDDIISTGAWHNQLNPYVFETQVGQHRFRTTLSDIHSFIDVNCYALPRSLAQSLANTWCIEGFGNDRNIFRELQNRQLIGRSTGQYTLNYTLDYQKIISPEFYQLFSQRFSPELAKQLIHQLLPHLNAHNIACYQCEKPWAQVMPSNKTK